MEIYIEKKLSHKGNLVTVMTVREKNRTIEKIYGEKIINNFFSLYISGSVTIEILLQTGYVTVNSSNIEIILAYLISMLRIDRSVYDLTDN
jgi:uncharacterized lipoprotein YajG